MCKVSIIDYCVVRMQRDNSYVQAAVHVSIRQLQRRGHIVLGVNIGYPGTRRSRVRAMGWGCTEPGVGLVLNPYTLFLKTVGLKEPQIL